MLLIGSNALSLEFPDLARHDEAWEVWLDPEESDRPQLQQLRFTPDEQGASCATFEDAGRRYRLIRLRDDDPRRLFLRANRDRPQLRGSPAGAIRIASPTSVALVWRAQLYHPRGWHSRITRYHELLGRLADCAATPDERAAYDALRADVLARTDMEPSGRTMRVSNDAFFRDFKYPWLRVFEHDDLHRATCYGPVPMYRQLKDDLSQAFVPLKGFERLSHPERVRLVREECYALALERVVIPAEDLGEPCTERRAFRHALWRISTTLAHGWFRDFAIDNHPEISRYDKPFVEDYRQALRSRRLERKRLAISDEGRRAWLMEYWRKIVDKDNDAAMPVDMPDGGIGLDGNVPPTAWAPVRCALP